MDEADIVSDKIVVIWKGILAAAGTSMELKKNYGKGYKLFIEIQSSRNGEGCEFIANWYLYVEFEAKTSELKKTNT